MIAARSRRAGRQGRHAGPGRWTTAFDVVHHRAVPKGPLVHVSCNARWSTPATPTTPITASAALARRRRAAAPSHRALPPGVEVPDATASPSSWEHRPMISLAAEPRWALPETR